MGEVDVERPPGTSEIQASGIDSSVLAKNPQSMQLSPLLEDWTF